MAKLSPRYKGPYILAEFTTPVSVKLMDAAAGNTTRAHISQLKLAWAHTFLEIMFILGYLDTHLLICTCIHTFISSVWENKLPISFITTVCSPFIYLCNYIYMYTCFYICMQLVSMSCCSCLSRTSRCLVIRQCLSVYQVSYFCASLVWIYFILFIRLNTLQTRHAELCISCRTVSDWTSQFAFLSHVRFEETVYSLGFRYLAGSCWVMAVSCLRGMWPLFMASGVSSSYRKVLCSTYSWVFSVQLFHYGPWRQTLPGFPLRLGNNF
jgi:hypothetical protein